MDVATSLESMVGDKALRFLRGLWYDEGYRNKIRKITKEMKERMIGFFPFLSMNDVLITRQDWIYEDATKKLIAGGLNWFSPLGGKFRCNFWPR